MFEDAFGLEAQLDDEIVAGLGADLALDDVAGDQVLDIFTGDELGGVLLGFLADRGGDHRVGFGVHVPEGVDEIEIDHRDGWGRRRKSCLSRSFVCVVRFE